jgi:DNA repair photolyase
MTTPVPLLTKAQIKRLLARAREVVEYRKSSLSLNHVQGCSLDCAYCIRHTYGLWDENQPRALMTDAQAVEELVNHPYFTPHVTPIQIFNRATEPFLPSVRPHTFAVLEDLDARELTNHVLVITRHQLKPYDIDRLSQLHNLKVTLLFTYSGIDNKDIEPYPSHVAADSLRLMSAPTHRKYRTILYWRPLVPGLNDTDEHLAAAHELSKHADATVFTGLFYRNQIAEYYTRPIKFPSRTAAQRAERSCLRRLSAAFWTPSRTRQLCSARPPALLRTRMACRTTTATTASANSVTSVRLASSNCARVRIVCRPPINSMRLSARCRRQTP